MANRLSVSPFALSRRSVLSLFGAAGGALALGAAAPRSKGAQQSSGMPSFTGPEANT